MDVVVSLKDSSCYYSTKSWIVSGPSLIKLKNNNLKIVYNDKKVYVEFYLSDLV